MNIALAVMGVTLLALIMVGFFMIINSQSDYFNIEFLVFYFIIMILLSVVMMKITIFIHLCQFHLYQAQCFVNRRFYKHNNRTSHLANYQFSTSLKNIL